MTFCMVISRIENSQNYSKDGLMINFYVFNDAMQSTIEGKVPLRLEFSSPWIQGCSEFLSLL